MVCPRELRVSGKDNWVDSTGTAEGKNVSDEMEIIS